MAIATLLTLASACGGGSAAVDTSTVPTRMEKTAEPSPSVPTRSTAGVFTVRVTNAAAEPVPGVTVAFAAAGSGTVSPSSAITDALGQAQTTVSAGASAGTITVTATISGTQLTATTAVTVNAINTASCGGLTTVRSLAVGEVASFQGVAAACLTGTAAGSEYALVAFNRDNAATATTTMTTNGLGTAPASDMLAPSASLALRGSTGERTLKPDLDFHRRLMARSEAMVSRFPDARRWQAARMATGGGSTRAPSKVPSYSALGATPQVGDVVTVNVNGDVSCTQPIMHGVRIMAVGTKSIVMEDTLDPSGGFTAADYQRFATQFDTLVYPMDTDNFGTPTDIDKNGRVGILFTRGVNELTPANSDFYIGGFFYDRDLFPQAQTQEFGAGCAGSNEGEMFYMLAPDPNGVVNGNKRSTQLVNDLTVGTIAHEFQHLINASRRIYVNTGAKSYESTWLNEGLSHIAEELLYYRETKLAPRSNLTDADIRLQSSAAYALWKRDQAQNFGRYRSFLQDPAANTLTNSEDLLATRGATWSFLRYAADRTRTADGDLWFKLVNSTVQGFGTLRLGFGSDPVGLIRDWAVSNYLDDSGFSTDPRYMQQSWNFRDIYTKTYVSGAFPLKVTPLASGASVSVSVRENSAAYYRFSVPANGEGLVQLSTTGNAPAAFEFVVVRTK